MLRSLTIAICTILCVSGADAKSRHHHRHHPAHHDYRIRIADLVAPLAAKVQEIQSACGSKLISGYRPGARIAGTNHLSLHSTWPAKAADMSQHATCIYAHLTNWQGGYSIDYGRVRHVHISYSPPGSGQLAGHEWHARFAHGGGHRHRHRYAEV